VIRRAAALLLAVAACTRSAADHEDLGDRAYAAGSYRDALAEYRLALLASPGRAPLHAKTAAAALHTEDYALAAAEYRALAAADRARSDEASDGLERVVRAALAANERSAGERALAALREIAPERPLGRYVRVVALDALDQGRPAEARALLPAAIAAAPDGRVADSLLYLFGVAAARTERCDEAVPAFEAVLRRGREPAVADGAREGMALCALIAGRRALAEERPADAEAWLRRATAPGAATEVARAAYLALGDLRLAQGDLAGALESYQQVLQSGGAADSLGLRAQERIRQLGRAEVPGPLEP
jgi:tetratricopeptide (TPR) repeat protein